MAVGRLRMSASGRFLPHRARLGVSVLEPGRFAALRRDACEAGNGGPERGNGLWPVADPINRCHAGPCASHGAGAAQAAVEAALQTLASTRAASVQHLPELSLLRVDVDGGEPWVYTLVHDRAHTNVAFMFGEESRLVPDEDIVTVIPGYHGSYPNFFFDVPAASVKAFATEMRAVSDAAAFEKLIEHWGVLRTSPRFWAMADSLQRDFAARAPVEAGLLDLNRFVDP